MERVKDFYKDNPFNFSTNLDLLSKSLIERNQILEYKDLHELLIKRNKFLGEREIKTIIEFGCGTGWLTNSIILYYKKSVKSIDFTEKALSTAKAISERLNLETNFVNSDIFNYEENALYDLVISMGVLHHTKNCREAFRKICKFVKPKGYVYLGLYHLYGRRPMLRFLQSYSRWHGEQSAYNLFKKMNAEMGDNEHSYSWFRDQVLHPHETQHTLEELYSWLEEEKFELKSTSINNYKSIKNLDPKDLIKLEKNMEKYSSKKNIEELVFNPGYFTICAKKRG